MNVNGGHVICFHSIVHSEENYWIRLIDYMLCWSITVVLGVGRESSNPGTGLS